MINYKTKNAIIVLIAFASVFAFAGKSYSQNNLRRIITFTTQNSIKLEASFNTIPSNDTKFNIKIADAKSGEVVFNEAAPPADIQTAGDKIIFYVNDLKVNEWTPVHPNLYRLTFTENLNGKTEQKNQRIGFRFFEIGRNGTCPKRGERYGTGNLHGDFNDRRRIFRSAH